MTRIDGLNPLSTSRTLNGSPTPGIDAGDNDRADGAGKAGGRQDVIALSHRGRIVAEAAAAVAGARDVRTEKVLALKAAIADGSYTSNARDIAERLYASGFAQA
jgi:negative regulator of flagellin synthesis FlgM